MLSEKLRHITENYAKERMKPFTKSAFGDFVRHDLAIDAKKALVLWPFELRVKASVGQGTWAAVPWLGFFDPLVTESATKGYYVVYLINPQDLTVTLSMNQGTTEIYQEYGPARGREVLARRARDIADRVPEFAEYFSTASINLGSEMGLPAGYEAGHAFGRTYQLADLRDDRLANDLHQMLSAYEALVNRGGITPADVMQDESGSADIEETRRYILSRRIERAPHVRRSVLKAMAALKCQCCGLDPKLDYGYIGSPERTPLDVHHAAPLRGLGEGETRRYKIPDDFMVLCPTCHRMIHMQEDPSDLALLKRHLRFKIAREIHYPMG